MRITHWINAIALWLLLMSGLQIFNAHPALYWGQDSRFAQPWLAMTAERGPGGELIGLTEVGGAELVTTGVFGASQENGKLRARGFPAAVTLPGERYLSIGRNWHFFAAWIFGLNALVYLAGALITRHLQRDLLPGWSDLSPRHLLSEVWGHLRLKFARGEEARRYNALQKMAYSAVIVVLLPLMAITGMCMSPTLNAALPWLPDIFGGRQSARSVHFIVAGLLTAFFVAHIVMVVVSGLWNNLRSMVTGRYAIEKEAA